jgi:undecaprenyl-diphosphatase
VDAIQAVVLGVIQGATEFIPISSSAHLVLVPWLLAWPSPDLVFDTVLHLGTLLAVLVILWPDLVSISASCWLAVTHRQADVAQAKMAWWIILGTMPAAAMGVLWEDRFERLFHSPVQVSVLLLMTGVWLVLADRLGRSDRQVENLSWWQALLIGVAQGCAIAPGISRSGATIGAAVLLGFKRDVAARFSFLLAVPIILGAGLLQVVRLLGTTMLGAMLLPLGLGFMAAFLSGYFCIRFLLAYLKQHSLAVFAVYCWFVGLGCLFTLLF